MSMTQAAINYAEVLYELAIPEDVILEMEEIFKKSAPLKKALENPLVEFKEKSAVIDRVFQPEIRSFLKVLCKYQSVSDIFDIVLEYRKIVNAHNHVVEAKLMYVTEPDDKQIQQMKAFVKKAYGCSDVELTTEQHKELLGGFILAVGHEEYDWSYRGRLRQLQQKLIRR